MNATEWIVLVQLLNWPYSRGGGPCGGLSVQGCLDTYIQSVRKSERRDIGKFRNPGSIHALAVHRDDWESGRIQWDCICNRVLTTAKNKSEQAALEFLTICDPPIYDHSHCNSHVSARTGELK